MISIHKDKLNVSIQQNEKDNYHVRLIIHSESRLDTIDLTKIIKFIYTGNEVIINITNNRVLKLSTSLKKIERVLGNFQFVRVNSSSIINVNFIDNYNTEENFLVLNNGEKLPVSMSKRKILYREIESISENNLNINIKNRKK